LKERNISVLDINRTEVKISSSIEKIKAKIERSIENPKIDLELKTNKKSISPDEETMKKGRILFEVNVNLDNNKPTFD
jgi:hypothetical protein